MFTSRSTKSNLYLLLPLLCMLFLGSTSEAEADSRTDLGYPFGPGQTWYVYQGYNTSVTHNGRFIYSFDLVKDSMSNSKGSAGAEILAASTGTLSKYYIDSCRGWGVKITMADGYVVEYDHLMNLTAVSNGQQINKGAYIGQIFNAECSGINHLHFQVMPSYSGTSVPLDFGVWHYPANGPQGSNGVWSGTAIKSALPDTPGAFQIVASHSGRCLDVDRGGGTNNGARVQQWDCVGVNQTNQLWSLRPVGDAFQIVARHSGKCLDVDSNGAMSDGTKIQQWDCLGTNQTNQLWRFYRFGDMYELRPVQSDKCLEVGGGRTENGAPTNQWGCFGAPHQRWQLRPVGSFDLVALHSNKCLEVGGGRTEDGATTNQWGCFGAPHQRWVLRSTGDGVEILAKHSGKCLEVGGGRTENGASINQWSCFGAPHQRWRLNPLGSTFEIVAVHSGKCLDVEGASQSDGMRVHQWSCGGVMNQRWIIRTP